ncbi:hypothetical protein [Floridanema fluviatile]
MLTFKLDLPYPVIAQFSPVLLPNVSLFGKNRTKTELMILVPLL